MLQMRDDQWERIREHFLEEHIPDSRPGRKQVHGPRDLGSRALDFEPRRAMAHAAVVLPQLHNGASSRAAAVRSRGPA